MIRSNDTNRPQSWEDETPPETRYRRVQQAVPPTGRVLPGMPLEMTESEDDDAARPSSPRFSPQRFDKPRGRWWRPASTWGRLLLGFTTLIVIGGLAAGLFLAKRYLARDSRFLIAGSENIEATGLNQVTRAEMLPIFGEDIGRNIFFVPLSERRQQLEQIPWIERATVMRLLPDQIRVSVVERKPVAFVRQGSQIGLVDADGILLNMPAADMAQHHYSFPVVTGIDPNDPPGARKERMAVYGRLVSELDANSQHLSEQISEIDLKDAEDAQILMPEQGTDILAHMGEDHFLERYQRYKAHIAEWRQQYPKLQSVDLRYDQQVVLEMTPGNTTTQTPDGQAQSASADTKPATQNLPKKAPAKPKAIPAAKASVKPGAKTSPKPKTAPKGPDKKRVDTKKATLDLTPHRKPRPAADAGLGQ